MMASLLTVAGAVAVTLVVWVTGGDGGATQATGPTPPADCFVADEPTPGGPAAPTELAAEISAPHPSSDFDLTWSDQSDDETCFVLERKSFGLQYDVIAILGPDTTSYRDEDPHPEAVVFFYRLYAARDNDRSEYSNVAGPSIPPFDPTPSPPPVTPTPPPTPPPTPTPTPTPTPEETASPSPSPSPAATPAPAQLPKTGGPAEGSSAPVAAVIIVGAALLILSAAVVLSRRWTEERRF